MALPTAEQKRLIGATMEFNTVRQAVARQKPNVDLMSMATAVITAADFMLQAKVAVDPSQASRDKAGLNIAEISDRFRLIEVEKSNGTPIHGLMQFDDAAIRIIRESGQLLRNQGVDLAPTAPLLQADRAEALTPQALSSGLARSL